MPGVLLALLVGASLSDWVAVALCVTTSGKPVNGSKENMGRSEVSLLVGCVEVVGSEGLVVELEGWLDVVNLDVFVVLVADSDVWWWPDEPEWPDCMPDRTVGDGSEKFDSDVVVGKGSNEKADVQSVVCSVVVAASLGWLTRDDG